MPVCLPSRVVKVTQGANSFLSASTNYDHHHEETAYVIRAAMIPKNETILPLYHTPEASKGEESKLMPTISIAFDDSHGKREPSVEHIHLPSSRLLMRPRIAILAQCIASQSLATLVVQNVIIDAAWLPLWKSLRCQSGLKCLSFETCTFQSPQVAVLALLHISNCSNLKSLRLEANISQSNYCSDLANMWGRLIARTATTLEHLEIHTNQTTTRVMGLGRGWTLAHMAGIAGVPLKTLNLSECHIGKDGLTEILEGLIRQKPCRLQVLNLSQNQLNPDSLYELSKMLELVQKTLVELDISSNPLFSNNSSSSVVDSLEWSLSQCRSLRSLSLADCKMPGPVAIQVLSSYQKLEHLDLSRNPIGPVAWPILMQRTLPSMKELRSLNIAETLLDTSNKFVTSYFSSNTSLEHVTLSRHDDKSLVESRIQEWTQRNARFRKVQDFVESEESRIPAIWGAAYQSLTDQTNIRSNSSNTYDVSSLYLLTSNGVVVHGVSSPSSKVTIESTASQAPCESDCDDDKASETSIGEWSTIEGIDYSAIDDYSVIDEISL